MKFSEKLNDFIEQLSCTGKDICNLSGISAASLSRYRNGERVPELGTKPFEDLCCALAQISAQKGKLQITADAVKKAFVSCDDFVSTDKELLRKNFNTLLSALNVNLTQLCQYTNYDASAIFRIRNGSRKPGDAERFASAVASFVTRTMQMPSEIAAVAELIGCDIDEIYDMSVRYAKIKSWLLKQPVQKAEGNSVSKFLSKLDDFDLNEYIKVIKFDELKVLVGFQCIGISRFQTPGVHGRQFLRILQPFVEQGLLALQHDDVQAYFLRLQQYLLAEGGGLCIQCICLEIGRAHV